MTQIAKLSDEQVVKLVREQNKELYAEIINRYQAKLMRYATYLTQDSQKAADVVQETFIKAYIKLNSFDIKKKFSSWIYRITHNEAMNIVNLDKNNHPLNDQLDLDSGVNIEDDYIKKELRLRAQNCLKQMPTLYSEVLSLYFIEEKSYIEISDILRIPIGTVGTRINRAKVLMRKVCQITKK